jgi:hypothetical protein
MHKSESTVTVEMALDITRRMHEHALRGEWIEVLELDRTRVPLLSRMQGEATVAECAPLMRELLSRNEDLRAMCANAQIEMRAAMRTAGRGRKAARAYSRA